MREALELPYVAGLFDGEGTVGVYLTNKNFVELGRKPIWGIRLSIVGSHLPMIERLHATFGFGSVHKSKRYDRKKHKQIWVWSLSSKIDVESFLTKIRPWLIEKAQQSDLATAFCRGELEADQANRLLAAAKKVSFGDEFSISAPRRVRRGQDCGTSKLTDDLVTRIKSDLISRPTARGVQKQVAQKFGVDPRTVSRIARGEGWAHIEPKIKRPISESWSLPKSLLEHVQELGRPVTFAELVHRFHHKSRSSVRNAVYALVNSEPAQLDCIGRGLFVLAATAERVS